MGDTRASYRYSRPRIRRRSSRGRWELVCTREGSDGSVRTLTRLSDIPCSSADGRGERLAKGELERWVEELRDSEAVRSSTFEALEALEALDASRRANLEMPLLKYGELFNDRRVRRGEIELSTATNWMFDFTHYCVSCLPQGIRVRDVTHEDVTNMIDEVIHGRGLAQATARRGFLALNQLMKEAVAVDGLPKNPCATIKAPKRGTPRQNPLSVRKAKAVTTGLMQMRMTKTVFAALCALLFGISEGEVCGLRVRDVDLEDTRSMLIRTAIGKNGSKTYEKGPKVDPRRRRIYLTGLMASVIRRRISELEAECQEAGREMTDEHFLVGRPDGTYWSPRLLSKSWGQMSETLGLKGLEGQRLTYHDLRHTFATCANAAGVDVNTIAKIMGHSTTQVTTMVYISVDPEESVRSLMMLEQKFDLGERASEDRPKGESALERRTDALSIFGYSDVG